MEKSSVTLHMLHDLLIAAQYDMLDQQPMIACRCLCRFVRAYITWLSDIHKQLGPLIYIRLAHNHVSGLLSSMLTKGTLTHNSVKVLYQDSSI